MDNFARRTLSQLVGSRTSSRCAVRRTRVRRRRDTLAIRFRQPQEVSELSAANKSCSQPSLFKRKALHLILLRLLGGRRQRFSSADVSEPCVTDYLLEECGALTPGKEAVDLT